MKTKDFLSGLTILMPYYDQPDGYHLGADHDVIYVYATEKPVSPEDVAKLVELGFHQPGGANSDGGEYSPHESWEAFT